MTTHESDQKLGELILYISEKSAFDPYFGATKLNKILYFSDFLAYGNWGESITGAEYQHLERGPAPKRLVPVRDQLVAENALAIQTVQFSSGKKQRRTINLREPDLSLFLARDISLVDDIIGKLTPLNADETSELSHRYVGWKSTDLGETIPYGTIFLSDAPPSPAELRRAESLANELLEAVG
jgi:hypothetical protein